MFKNWPFVGLFFSIMFWTLYILNFEMFFHDAYWPFRLIFPVLAIHQFEEFLLPGGFIKWANKVILKSKYKYAPINKKNTFLLNVLVAWPITVYISIYPYENIWITLGLTLSVILSNAFVHVFITIKKRRYSPGVLSSIFFLLPIGTAAIYFSIKHNLLYSSGWLIAISIAIIIDVIIILLFKHFLKKARR